MSATTRCYANDYNMFPDSELKLRVSNHSYSNCKIWMFTILNTIHHFLDESILFLLLNLKIAKTLVKFEI